MVTGSVRLIIAPDFLLRNLFGGFYVLWVQNLTWSERSTDMSKKFAGAVLLLTALTIALAACGSAPDGKQRGDLCARSPCCRPDA